jgi:hypothetical protein
MTLPAELSLPPAHQRVVRPTSAAARVVQGCPTPSRRTGNCRRAQPKPGGPGIRAAGDLEQARGGVGVSDDFYRGGGTLRLARAPSMGLPSRRFSATRWAEEAVPGRPGVDDRRLAWSARQGREPCILRVTGGPAMCRLRHEELWLQASSLPQRSSGSGRCVERFAATCAVRFRRRPVVEGKHEIGPTLLAQNPVRAAPVTFDDQPIRSRAARCEQSRNSPVRA